jgi:hypothetical protein
MVSMSGAAFGIAREREPFDGDESDSGSETQAERKERIRLLREQIEAGTYRIDPDKLSKAILDKQVLAQSEEKPD